MRWYLIIWVSKREMAETTSTSQEGPKPSDKMYLNWFSSFPNQYQQMSEIISVPNLSQK